MEIYLVQHGEAKSEQEDPGRPLTDQGKQEVEKVARYLAKQGIRISEIWHSTKLRARQTAEIFAQYLKPNKIGEMQGITPNDDPKIAKEFIEMQNSKPGTGNIMLVGHLPHLSKLASRLLVGNENAGMVAFRYAGVVCLRKNENQIWQMKWMIIPEVV